MAVKSAAGVMLSGWVAIKQLRCCGGDERALLCFDRPGKNASA